MGFYPFAPLAGLSDWLNVVTQYGADPTGTADSTTAIQNAITAAGAAGGKAVYLPAGTYEITSALALASGVSVFGDGPASVLKAGVTGASAMNLLTGNTVSNFELAHFAIDGNLANRTPAGLETTQCDIYLTSCSNGLIHDLTVRNSASNGICLTGCSGIPIGRNVCYGNQRNGIALSWSGNTNCPVGLNVCFNQVLWSGIAVDDSAYNPVTGNTCYGNGVSGGNASAGIWLDGKADGCAVAENTCYGNRGDGIHVGDTGSAVRGPQNITVTGNTCHGNYRCGIQTVCCTAPVIEGNNIYNNSQESANFYDGIHLSSVSASFPTTNAVVTGNVVNANHANGVNVVDGNTTGCRIIGNDLTGNSSAYALNTTAYMAQNKGVNPVGHGLPGGQPGVPVSGTPLVNTTSFDCMVLVAGGTVTQIAVGGTNTGLTSGWFRVPFGQSITLTWSIAPTTFLWFGD